MDPGGRRDGRDRSASTSERVYRALVRAYPEEVWRRYADEMVRYFGDLCREELQSRGTKGLALLWARTLPELVFTALKERGAMLPRNVYLPVAPRTAARWGALSALVGGSLGTLYSLAYTLVIAEFPVDWTWWDGQFTVLILFAATLLSILGIFGLYGTLVARLGRPGRLWLPGEGFSWWERNRTMILQEVGLGACVLGLLLLGTSAFRARPAVGRGLAMAGEHCPSHTAKHVRDGISRIAQRHPALPRRGDLRLGYAKESPCRTPRCGGRRARQPRG